MLRIGHRRQVDQRRDLPAAPQRVDLRDFTLERVLFFGLLIRERHPQQRQAFPGAGQRLGVFRQVLVLHAAQARHSRQVDRAACVTGQRVQGA